MIKNAVTVGAVHTHTHTHTHTSISKNCHLSSIINYAKKIKYKIKNKDRP